MASADERLQAALEKAQYEKSVDERLQAAIDKAKKAEESLQERQNTQIKLNQAANRVIAEEQASVGRQKMAMTGTERREAAASQAAAKEALNYLDLYANRGLTGTERREKQEDLIRAAQKAAAEEERQRNKGLTGTERLAPLRELEQQKKALEAERDDMYANPGNYIWTEALTGTERRERGFDYTKRPDIGVEMAKRGAEYDAKIAGIDQKMADFRSNAYRYITYEPDFRTFSQQGAEMRRPQERSTGDSELDTYLEQIGANAGAANKGTVVNEAEHIDIMKFLNYEENSIYNYLLAKYGQDSADIYLDTIIDELNKRKGANIAKILKSQEGMARVVQTGGFAMRSGLDQFGSGAVQAFSDEVRDVTPVQYGAQFARADLADAGPKVLGSSLGQWAFDTTQTIGNMLPSMLISMGAGAFGAPAKLAKLMGAGAMGTSAGGNTYATAVREGMDPDEARAYARLVGTAAGLLQYAIGGIDKLSGGYGAKLAAKAAGIENGFLRFITTHGVNALSEASEEALEAILEPLFKKIATGGEGDIDWSEVIYNALLGGLTGAILGGDGEAEATQPNVEEEAGRVPRLPRVTNTEEETRPVPPLPKVGTNAESATQSVVPPLPKVGTNAAAQSDAQGRVPSLPTVESVRQRANEVDRQAEREKAQKIADKLGVKLEFRSLGENRRGMYENGVITLNSDRGDAVMEVFVHELTHHLESSGNYGRLRNAALRYISENMGADISAMKADVVAEYAEGGIGLDDVGAERELVAQFCSEMVFTDEESIIRLARTDRNLAQRIYDWICDTISKIGKSADTRALINARRMYENALRTVGDTQGEGANAKYSISSSFNAEFDRWLKNGKPDRQQITVGTTSDALKSIGVDDKVIKWDTSKINKIQREHLGMSDGVIRQVPNIIENPILVMESKTQPNRLTMFGEVYNDNGLPVMAVLELRPTSRNNYELDQIKVANAYSKDLGRPDAGPEGTQNIIDTSEILYVEPDKKRTDTWLSRNQLHLPLGIDQYGPIGSIALVSRDSQGNFSADSKLQEIPEWKKKLQSFDAQASYGSSFEERVERAGGKVPEKSQQQKAAEKKQRVTIAKRDLRRDLLGLFSVPEGQRGAMGSMIDSIAEESLKNGEISVNDRERLFDTLYESGVVTQQAEEYLSVGRSAVVGGHIYVSEYVRSEFGDDWNSFRRRAFGAGVYLTSNFSDPGVDVWNAELADILPGLFDAGETDSRTMLENIVDIAEAGKDEKLSLSDYTARIAKQERISEDELIEHMERQVDWALRSFGEKAKLELWFKQKMDEKVQAEREKSWEKRKEQIHRQKENRELRELQQRTLKQLQWLSRNRHKAPTDLRAAWDEVLSDIDIYAVNAANEMNWSKKHQATWKDLAAMYTQAAAEDPNFLPNAELARITSRINDVKIGDMKIEDLQVLYKAAVTLRTELYNRKNLINDELHRAFADVYTDAKKELTEAAKGHKEGWYENGISQLLNTDQLTPMNVFQRMAGWNPDSVWYGMGRQLEQGERDMRSYYVEANRYLEEFLRKNEKWVKRADGQGKDAVWYEITVPELSELGMGDEPIFGDTVTVYMTPAQKVHLYLESKNVDNLRHMVGGRTFADKALYSKGRREEALKNGKIVKLAPETVKKIVSDLTPMEMELATLLERYYNGFAKEEINRVSNILYGYDRAMNTDYAPIYTNQNYTSGTLGTFDVTAEGVGKLQARQYSKNPSYNISAFDAFERHVSQISRFVGMAIPTKNWNTLLNWQGEGTTMKEVISNTWGKSAAEYIMGDGHAKKGIINELQSGRSMPKTATDRFFDKLLSQHISSIFGFNPSIVTKQFGSVLMAPTELGMRNIPSIAKIAKIDKKLIDKYTSELAWRGLGYATPETKSLKNNPNWTETNKVVNFLFGGGAITAADQAAASMLWPWAENKVKREHPELERGTPEQIKSGKSPFYQKVAEEFNNAVNRSQSMSDETHQSTLRKSQNPIVRTFTMFKSDSAQGYNQLRQKIGEAQYYKRSGADKKTQSRANRAAGTAFLGILANNVWAVSVSLAIAALKNGAKNYRDDEGELTAGSVLAQMAMDLVKNVAGLVTFGEELADIIGSELTGEKWYDFETPGLEQLSDLIEEAVSKGGVFADYIKGWHNVSKNGGDVMRYHKDMTPVIVGGIKDIAKTASAYLGGVPSANIEAYLLGLVRLVSPGIAEAYEMAFEESTKDTLSGLEGDALAVRVYGVLENRLDEVEEETSDALAALYEAGSKGVIPSDTPGKITVDGEEIALNAYQQQIYDKVWCDSVRGTIDEVVASEEFAATDNAGKEKILKRLYDYAAAMAKSEVSDKYEAPKWVGDVTEAMKAGVSFAEMASEGFAYWDGSSQANSYDEFTKAGVSAESAKDLADAIDALQPVGDAKQVSDMQKLRAIANSGLNAREKDAALGAIMSESQLESWHLAKSEIPLNDFIDGIEIKKNAAGVKDANGETISGSKAFAVMQGIDDLRMSDEKKAILFEALGYDTAETIWNTEYEGDDYEAYFYMTDSARQGYMDYCSWMKAGDYAEYYEAYSTFFSDKDSNGKTIKAKKEKVIEYVDSLDLTADQKSALFVSFGYAKSGLKDCIWYNPIAMRSKYFPAW